VWAAYFAALGDAAASGLFDVLAHPDLVKVWGRDRPDPPRPAREYYELAIDRIAAADIAVEVSTAGLRKPVGEIYPARELLEMCVAAGKPVSLSSDAHEPEWIGHGYERALELLRECGVANVSVFEDRQRREVPLG
jgi:histidinol-phosphatase (PHP family)